MEMMGHLRFAESLKQLTPMFLHTSNVLAFVLMNMQ